MNQQPTPAPWSYLSIRLLFKFVLKIFYGTIVVENVHLIPASGMPCIIYSNHSNSLTDALLLVTSIPQKRRNFLRLTAKATQFGKKTLTSWLIESAGTLPLKRRNDTPGMEVDNTEAVERLLQALDKGDAICLFPEGISRYHPTIAPLKTGVARLISNSLNRNRHKEDYKIALLACSITYMHREHFRSDVLITFHPPLTFTPQTNPELLDPVDFTHIRALTNLMQKQISSGTYDVPSWELIRVAKLATRIYAPLGTSMSLGEFVRISKAFTEVFKWAATDGSEESLILSANGSDEEDENIHKKRSDWINQLRLDLKEYQDQLTKYRIKDDRVRRRLSRITILLRICIRLQWSIILFLISLPGLSLWSPIFMVTRYAVTEFKKTGPVWDTWDEIAQYKLVYGLISGVCVWLGCIIMTLPIAPLTAVFVPLLMWISLRWFEDAVSAFRAFVALITLIYIGDGPLQTMRGRRKDLYSRVMLLATSFLGLPANPEVFFAETGGKEKGRVRGQWESDRKYFSLRRRRKRDWNETLRLYDMVDYPEENFP